MNKILRKQKPTSTLPQSLNVNEKLTSDPEETCNELNKHFVSIGKKILPIYKT